MVGGRVDLTSAVQYFLDRLGVNDTPEKYVRVLEQNISDQKITKMQAFQTKRSLTESTSQPVQFNNKYDDNKAKGLGESQDKMLAIVLKLRDDPEIIRLLHPVSSPQAPGTISRTPATTASRAHIPKGSRTATASHRKGHGYHDATPSSGIGRSGAGTDPSSTASRALFDTPAAGTGAGSASTGLSGPPRKYDGDASQDKSGGGGSGGGDQQVPVVPDWVRDRAYLTGEFLIPASDGPGRLSLETKRSAETLNIGTLAVPIQEMLIVEDLLYTLIGVEGRFIHAASKTGTDFHFVADPSLDPSLAELTTRVLPVCVHYVKVSRFVEKRLQFQYGLCSHAFAAAIKDVLKDYLILVAQLEHQFRTGELSLQKLWFYLQSSMSALEALSRVTSEAQRTHASGASLLNLIHMRASNFGGATLVKDLLSHILAKAAKPYLTMLKNWIYRGVIQDTYGEFVVAEKKDVSKENMNKDYNDAYWDTRYSLRKSEPVPRFIEGLSHKILNAGKYLNVILECGKPIVCPFESDIEYNPHDRAYVEVIEKAYTFASNELLQLLLKDHELVARLKSIKHYFFIDQGDFLVHFMDAAHSELSKDYGSISKTKLVSLLELAVKTASTLSDPYGDDLSCELLPYNLINQLLRIINVSTEVKNRFIGESASLFGTGTNSVQGFEAFTLDYTVKWPISLVVSRKALTKYQLIFRHLFHCKYVGRALADAWKAHITTRHMSIRQAFASSHALRHRMSHFLRNFEHYMMYEVLEPNWHKFEHKLPKVHTVDDLLQLHNDLLDTCMKECLLTNPRLMKILTKLMSTCVIFSEYTERFMQSLSVNEDGEYAGDSGDSKAQRSKVATDHIESIVSDPEHIKTIQTFTTNFDTHMGLLIRKLNEFSRTEAGPHMTHLCARLNYNSYYEIELNAGGEDGM